MKNVLKKYFLPFCIFLLTGCSVIYVFSHSKDLSIVQESQNSKEAIFEGKNEQQFHFENDVFKSNDKQRLFAEVIDLEEEKDSKYYKNVYIYSTKGSFVTTIFCSIQLGHFYSIRHKNALYYIFYPTLTKFRRLITFQNFRI
ncbi:MAG: hypothetical protein ACI8VZ_002438 [Candidatus Paceibacteria bacterium]|jgi:hypothetical protein